MSRRYSADVVGGDDLPKQPRVSIAPAVTYVPKQISADSPLHEVMEDDIAHYSFMLLAIREAWKCACNIDDVCRLALTTTAVLKERRKAMLLPAEAVKDPKGAGGFLEPPEEPASRSWQS